MLHVNKLYEQMLHGQMLRGQILHGKMLHGQMLHRRMVLGHLSTVKDGSTNLKCPPRFFPWGGGGGEKLKLMLLSPAQLELGVAGTGAELGNIFKLG